jgi:cytoplasmic iron level regulating protein YaaA (DUF328/UPF0246 family)
MLLVLSPAKSLDYESPIPAVTPTQPSFIAQAERLIARLRELDVAQVAKLMDLSDKLAELNVARYRNWSPTFTEQNARPAVLAFDGDVYEGLQARQMSPADLQWAQTHLAILSGLYGVLRPLDLMQAYRLEMGTRLPVDQARDLYGWWGTQLADWLNQAAAQHADPVIVNLASEEYFKAAARRHLKVPVIDCVFEDWKNGQWKVISFHAKRARGLMARHVITKRLERREQLSSFSAEGYGFDTEASSPERLVFRRREAG